jgi:hypothetical protein
MSPSIRIESRSAEGVICVFMDTLPSDAEYRGYLDEMERMLHARRGQVVVLTLAGALRLPEHQRRMQSDWLARNARALRERSPGTALVLPSALLRFAMSAMLMLSPMPHPYRVCDSLDEALEWAARRRRVWLGEKG